MKIIHHKFLLEIYNIYIYWIGFLASTLLWLAIAIIFQYTKVEWRFWQLFLVTNSIKLQQMH